MARRDPMMVPPRDVLDRFPKAHAVHRRFTRLPIGHPLRHAYELLYAAEPEANAEPAAAEAAETATATKVTPRKATTRTATAKKPASKKKAASSA